MLYVKGWTQVGAGMHMQLEAGKQVHGVKSEGFAGIAPSKEAGCLF